MIADEAVDQLMRTAPMLLSATWRNTRETKRNREKAMQLLSLCLKRVGNHVFYTCFTHEKTLGVHL